MNRLTRICAVIYCMTWLIGNLEAGNRRRYYATAEPPVVMQTQTVTQTTTATETVNALRVSRGLRPFIVDVRLEEAAKNCATYRARYRIRGHTANDFQFVPPGARADSGGCAAWEPGFGWGSCCTFDQYTHGGAAWAIGDDGLRYMQLFVRNGGGLACGCSECKCGPDCNCARPCCCGTCTGLASLGSSCTDQ